MTPVTWQDLAEAPTNWEDKLRRVIGAICPQVDGSVYAVHECGAYHKVFRGPICPWCGQMNCLQEKTDEN